MICTHLRRSAAMVVSAGSCATSTANCFLRNWLLSMATVASMNSWADTGSNSKCMAPASIVRFPATDDSADIEAARAALFSVDTVEPDRICSHFLGQPNYWWTDPVFLGAYPEDALSRFGHLMPKKKGRRVSVEEARRILEAEEREKLVDLDKVTSRALKAVEETGIVFIDEIDKIAATGQKHGPDVSREGVQRDILPIVEGSTVNTKYGVVKTDHILFIAAGAFHMSKPSDLVPELQGRFPIRVELDSLTAEDFERILLEPENALLKQYTAIIETEGCKVTFTKGAVKEIARVAFLVNSKMENIGARRLHTVMTTLLEEILFELPDPKITRITINGKTVKEKLDRIIEDEDLARYIL